jgi:hypothetical protein
VAERPTEPAQTQSAYVGARGWAMGTSTRRLRWRLRRLARHTTDQQQAAQVKALRDELRSRGMAL